MATYGFDGVDIAIEFSDADIPEDKAALTILLEVRLENLYQREKYISFPFFYLGNSKTKTINVKINCYINSSTICRKSFKSL